MNGRRIAVLGGGHGARTVAVDMALAGHKVSLFEFEQFHDNIAEIFERKQILIKDPVHGRMAAVMMRPPISALSLDSLKNL